MLFFYFSSDPLPSFASLIIPRPLDGRQRLCVGPSSVRGREDLSGPGRAPSGFTTEKSLRNHPDDSKMPWLITHRFILRLQALAGGASALGPHWRLFLADPEMAGLARHPFLISFKKAAGLLSESSLTQLHSESYCLVRFGKFNRGSPASVSIRNHDCQMQSALDHDLR